MTALQEHQFEILPSAEASDGFVFGIGATVSVSDGGFDPGETEWLMQDAQNSRRGVTAFGRDVVGSRTWVWESHVNRSRTTEAVETLEQFADAWMPDALVRDPGALTALRYRLAGRDRRIFGRPRRFAAPPTNLIMSGFVPVTHDFQLVDSFTYDDEESTFTIGYVSSAEGGGFVLPAVMPLVTTPSLGNGSGQLTVGGSARAYPVIRLNGPWTNPVVETNDWTLSWVGTIPDGDWLEIDARPWALTVLDSSGASRVGGLDRRTWLEDIWFAPQSQPQIALRGVATSGSASCFLRWRNTWKSI